MSGNFVYKLPNTMLAKKKESFKIRNVEKMIMLG